MIMSIVAACIVGVIWVLIGDSIAYGNATDTFDENGNLVNTGDKYNLNFFGEILMKLNKLMLVGMLLLAILTLGAVGAYW